MSQSFRVLAGQVATVTASRAALVYRVEPLEPAVAIAAAGSAILGPFGEDRVYRAECDVPVTVALAAPAAAVADLADDEAVNALVSASGVVTIDLSLGGYFTLVLTENVTSIVITNPPASGFGGSVMLRITQHASSAKTVAWPASFLWAGGTPGAVSTGASAVDLVAITSFNQGTSWLASIAKAFA